MSTNFGKDILKIEKFFQLSFPKYPNFPGFSEQMNQLTDTQTKNSTFFQPICEIGQEEDVHKVW